MNSLFIEQILADFWPEILALEQRIGGGGRFLREIWKNTVLPLENSNPNTRDY